MTDIFPLNNTTMSEIISKLRRCGNETQLYGYLETLVQNDMKFWPDSCYKTCTEFLREAMGNPELPLYPFVNLQDEFEHTAKIFLTRTWVGLESKKDLPITKEEVTHMENEAKKIDKEAYLEMIKDIINNGAEYEVKGHMTLSDKTSDWEDYDITDGFNECCEYRKKQPKTWLEENVGDNTPGLEAIKAFYEEFIKRFSKSSYAKLEAIKIARDMGVEVDD